MLQTRQWHILNVFFFTDKQTYRFLPWDICVAKTLQEIQQCCFFFLSNMWGLENEPHLSRIRFSSPICPLAGTKDTAARVSKQKRRNLQSVRRYHRSLSWILREGQEYYCLWGENLIKARVFNQIKLSLSNKILRFNEDDGFKKYYIFIEGWIGN